MIECKASCLPSCASLLGNKMWQNQKGIGIFLGYFSNLDTNIITSKRLWDALRQIWTTVWYKMPLYNLETKYDKIKKALGYFEAEDKQLHDIRSPSLSPIMKPWGHERQ